ncbi:MAG: hypothetical protein ACOZFS_14165 [Thermodesulfobacteriota bacterium]
MRRKPWIIVVTIVVLASALTGGLYWRWANSPRYALQQAALALKTRDMDRFFQYIDLKKIVTNFSEASHKDLATQDDQQADEFTRYSRRMGGKFAQLFLPKLIDSFEPQIRRLLEHYLLDLNDNQILGIAAAATMAEIDTQGDEAQVSLTDPKTQEKFRFQMRRLPNHGAWQIVSVNYDDLKRFAKRELQY